MKQQFKNKNAEGYVETCISVFIILCILVVIINLFSFVTLKSNLDQIVDELVVTAAYSGGFGTEFSNRKTELEEDYGSFYIDCGAERYFNTVQKKVQLGERMWVKVQKDTYIKGLGTFKIPITATVKRSGLSERYWKAGE